MRSALAAFLMAVVVLCGAAPPAYAGLEPYESSNDPMATTPSTDEGAFGAWHNPAVWAIPERPVLDAAVFHRDESPDDVMSWQLGIGRGFGFAVRHRDDVPGSPFPPVRSALPSLTEYQLALAAGNGAFFHGIAWHLNDGGGHAWRKSNYLSFGTVARPNRHVSIGTAYQWAPTAGSDQTILDIGLRPLGTSQVTLFADYALHDFFRDRRKGQLGIGAAVRPIDGLEFSGRWREDRDFQFTAGLTLARFGMRGTPRYHDLKRPDTYSGPEPYGADHLGTWYSMRLSPPVRGLDMEARTLKNRRTMSMDLHGHATYQPYRWLDRDSKALRDLTEQIRFAKEDPTIGGVAIHLSGFEANASVVWELRESLLALKRAGKKVFIAADNLDQRSYYLASVADRLVLDPMAGLLIPGVQASRTYMKDLLAKLGLGFDEWRYYKYKSAFETFSRTSFSEADREQFDALVHASYEELANGIAATGRITRERFDQVVNEEPYLRAHRLMELGLADTLGRWEDLEQIVKIARGTKPQSYSALARRRWQPDETWGAPPTVALVYLIGDCAMDTGIRARTTAPAMRRLREDKNVRGVVLRVDSPGGDPLASDLVAEETRRLRKAKKPVLVSQGRVAGSGGYWISMDGDSIFAGPFTITGSIGIIGGWVWNDGFGKKTGLTSDHVQVGKSSDLLGGLRVPFVGVSLPERNLDEGERRLIQRTFDDLYGMFVQRVAAGRGLPETRVRELAEGHVYDGRAGVANGLVDRIGTLEEAVEAAKAKAKPARHQRARVVETPGRPFIRLPRLFPSVRTGLEERDAPRLLETSVLQQIIDQPGRPLLVTPGSLLPMEEEPIR